MDKEIYIRHADPDEWKIIRALNSEIFQFEHKNFEPTWNLNYPFTTEARKYYIAACTAQSNLNAFVCTIESKIIGYGILRRYSREELSYRNNVSLFHIETLYIREAYRNNGFGEKLVNHLIIYAKDNGATHISVNVLDDNKRASRFYGRIGFKGHTVALEQKLND